MSDPFPIPVPARLPDSISPCPIVEAIFELRFTTTETWATLPGLLYALIRDKYRDQRRLPLDHVPEELRKDSAFTHMPLLQFLSPDFLIQLGPRVISLVTKSNAYPGWPRIKQELEWLLGEIKKAGFLDEGERLGIRYIDFFAEDIFPNLLLNVHLCGQPLKGSECQVATVLRRPPLAMRLIASNGAVVKVDGVPKSGSILDVDAWFGALDFDVFENGVKRFDDAHLAVKQLFFGLLREEYLATLNPQYP